MNDLVGNVIYSQKVFIEPKYLLLIIELPWVRPDCLRTVNLCRLEGLKFTRSLVPCKRVTNTQSFCLCKPYNHFVPSRQVLSPEEASC